MKEPRLRVIALAILAGSVGSVANAQTAWLAPNSGSWSIGTNWTVGVPVSGIDATLGHTTAYTVAASGGNVRDLGITNSLAGLTTASGTTFSVFGNISNNGSITVNASGGAANANFSINAAASSLTGTGTLILNAVGSINDADLIASPDTNVLTQGAGHTITGHGQVWVAMVNNGLIVADGVGEYLQLLLGDKANSGLFLAQNGATLDVEGIAVDQSGGGTVRASGTGSTVEAHGGIVGGAVEGVSGGLVRSGGALLLDGVDVNGLFNVLSGHTVSVQTSLTNAGTITVNPTGGFANAAMSFNSPAVALDGSGTIVLNGPGSINDANLTASVATNVLTQSAGHTITGVGQVFVAMVNNGLIVADGAGKYIQLLTGNKVNNALFLAQNGATLDVEGITVDQSAGGTLRATGTGSIGEAHGGIIGGTVEGLKGAIVRSGGALLLDGVDLNGAFHVQSGHTVSVSSSLTNTGTITINASGGAADAVLMLTSSLAIDGGGTVALNGVGSILDARIAASVAASVLTLTAGNTVTGNGQVAAGLINNGLVVADGAGRTVQLMSANKVNNTLMAAQNGGMVDVEGIAIDQSSGGTLRATGAGSIAEAHGTITGGVAEGVSGGIVRSGGALVLDGVDLNGVLQVQSSHTVSVVNSITNTGTIIVNPSAGATDAVLSFNGAASTVDGAGAIVLNAVGSIGDARVGPGAAGNALTNAAGHTIAGNGQIALTTVNQGILSPGHASNGDLTQRIELLGAEADVSCGPTSTVRIELEGSGAGQFDSMTGGAGTSFVCGGTLEVSHLGGFTGPGVGTAIDIIVAPSVTGTFSTVVAPALPNNGRYIVVYLPDRVRLIATCYANCDDSIVNPVLTPNDFACFLNRFADAASYANCDGSTGAPALTPNDFQCFLNRFAGGCF
jgi:hypothetical protein